jgi:3-oxoisoapionate decarboxylase
MLLGIHTYSLYHHGIGQAWAGFELSWPRQLTTFQLLDLLVELGLDGVQLDDGVLETLETSYLKEVKAAMDERGLFVEYNFSMDLGGKGIGIQNNLNAAIEIAHSLGAEVLKVGMDIRRPRPVAATRFHPDIMAQIARVADQLKAAAPRAEAAGVKLAVENHCDSFSEEILWLLDRVDSPWVGACIDTVNAMMVTEDPMAAIENLAPRSFTNHFKDHKIVSQRYGCKITGAAVGDGDIDMQRAFEMIKTQSHTNRIIIENEMELSLDDKDTALAAELEAVRRSIRYCREVLGIGKQTSK